MFGLAVVAVIYFLPIIILPFEPNRIYIAFLFLWISLIRDVNAVFFIIILFFKESTIKWFKKLWKHEVMRFNRANDY